MLNNNRIRWVGRRLVDLVVVVLFVAGVAKLADVPTFARALLTWKYIPRDVVMLLAYGVSLAELGIGLLWFLQIGRRVAVLGAATLLIVFTATYLYHTRDPGPPPDCGCLGRIIRYEAQQAAIGGLVVRNGSLLVGLLAGAFASGVFHLPNAAPGQRERFSKPVVRTPPSGQRGFTLLETIVVIALITLLVSLLMPSLQGVRARGREVRTLSNLRSHATNMAAYTGDWQDTFLFMTDPDLETTRAVVNGRDYDMSYWAPTIVWPLGLLEAYYDANMVHPSLIEETKDVAQEWGMWAYTYSASFLARPEFWNPETREGAHQLAPTRLPEVRYPGSKGVIVPSADYVPQDFDTRLMGRARWRVGFVDGSARAVAQNDLLPGYRTGEAPYGSGSTSIGFPITHTIDGVRGRDVK